MADSIADGMGPVVGRAVLLIATCVAVGACATPVGVTPARDDEVRRDVALSALDSGRLSRASERQIAYSGLTELCTEDPRAALDALHERAVEGGRAVQLFVLAELSYLIARRSGEESYYLGAAVYAYQYLFGDFGDDEDDTPSPFDPRFQIACGLYNDGLERALVSRATGEVELESREAELPCGSVSITATRPGFPWSEEHFARFLASNRLRLRGLEMRVREEGLGVPLVAVPRDVDAPLEVEQRVPIIDLAATAFLRVEGAVGETEGGLRASLELYAGLGDPHVRVGGRRVPLQVDLSTPLANYLDQPAVWTRPFTDFLELSEETDNGLHFLQPYERERIPVVFIHGTASGAARWAGLLNGLQGDARIREEYQGWFFKYATGNPVSFSARLLRDELETARAELDPEGDDPAFRRMVLVGHSQGGLLAKMMAVDSGDALWDVVSGVPLEELPVGPDLREMLRSLLFLERLPYVERVVMIATPHRGSYRAGTWYGRFLSRNVDFDRDVVEFEEVLKGVDVRWWAGAGAGGRPVPTSIDAMTDGDPLLAALAELSVAPGVMSHSIVAVWGRGDPEQRGDGMVKYESAHRDDVDSEIVVRDSHGCLSNAGTVLEVRRILLEHLDEGL